MKEIIYAFLGFLLRALLSLRYKVHVKGLLQTKNALNPQQGTLFLPNHPALIDPIIVFSRIARFCPRPLVDERQVKGVMQRRIAKALHMVTIPDVRRDGRGSSGKVQEAMNVVVEALRQGDSILLYPSGRLYRSAYESLGANSAVEQILRQLPDVNIVLVRSKGLWGSSFSYASGKEPFLISGLLQGLKALVCNLFFFTPRRPVELDVTIPYDFPRTASKLEINKYLEAYYNQAAAPALQYPLRAWGSATPQVLPEPTATGAVVANDMAEPSANDALASIDPHTLQQVTALLSVTIDLPEGIAVTPASTLAGDLGIDSLSLVDVATAIEQEFGQPVSQMDLLLTVADCCLAAQGKLENPLQAVKQPTFKAWAAITSGAQAAAPIVVPLPKLTFVHNFLRLVQQNPSRPFLVDKSGIKTRLQVLVGVLLLAQKFKQFSGKRLGIMLPATPAATIAWLACLLAGKEPVMLNWTVGAKNMSHCLSLTNVKDVVTAEALLTTLSKQGNPIATMPLQWQLLETVVGSVHLADKLKALGQALLHCARLLPVSAQQVPAHAAILFTSGSEAAPKAVPLLHSNILANTRDIATIIGAVQSDKLLAMLPPFHSFGLLLGMALPASTGIVTIFHPNPTESMSIALLIQQYQASLLAATPTFLDGVLARSKGTPLLNSLRFTFVGAEKCPDSVYDAFAACCPHAALCEGYGITECAPVIAANTPNNSVRGSIGLPLPSVQVAIVEPATVHDEPEPATTQDASSSAAVSLSSSLVGDVIPLSNALSSSPAKKEEYVPVAQGKRGILLVRGENVFSGYLGDSPHPFVQFCGREWYNTGDFVQEETTGHLRFLGRMKRFVKIGGEMISLPQMEAVLQEAMDVLPENTHESPITIAIEPVPHSEDQGAPQLVAFTSLNVSANKINQMLKAGGLSSLYTVAYAVKLDVIPVLGTGKTDYQQLKQLALEHFG